jgi:arylsulfatase A-like enzyme
MKKKFMLYTAIPILGLIAYGMYPLSTGSYAIKHDEEALVEKRALLNVLAQHVSDDRLPNIVLILADDLGWGDISLHGSEYLKTTHIDALAKRGVSFERGYVCSPVCAPSRAGLLTGRYQNRFGFEHQMQQRYLQNILMYYAFRYFIPSDPWSPIYMNEVPRKRDIEMQGLPPSEITIAELLKTKGYRTACIGKWHLGTDEMSKPNQLGFDYHYGFYNSHSLYAYENTRDIVNQKIPEDWTDQFIWGSQRDGSSSIVSNDSVIIEKDYLTSKLTKKAIEFMKESGADPFFLYLPYSTPHTPLQVPSSAYTKFDHIEDPYKRAYNAMIYTLDEAIGELNRAIQDLGIENNTLVIFLSDNGGATYTHTTDNAPLKGGKITYFEGGVRVPFIMKWAGVLPEGTVVNEMVSSLDILPTICGVAGIDLPSDRIFDGVNLLPFFRQSAEGVPHEFLYWEVGDNCMVMDGMWKLVFHRKKVGQLALYNIHTDPFEKTNVAGEYPEVVTRLKSSHEDWSGEMVSPLWPPVVTFRYEDETGKVFDFVN